MVNNHKINSEQYGDLNDDAYSRYDANMFDNQDPFCQTKTYEIREAVHFNAFQRTMILLDFQTIFR